jgi:F-type H+-transporting ATPase subunit b
LSDAAAMRAAADVEKAAILATRAGFAAERDSLLSTARRQIEIERAAMLRDASERIETLRSEQETVLARTRNTLEHAITDQASTVAVQIAQRLLERLPTQAALAGFLDNLSEQIKALPAKSHDMLVASGKDGVLSVSTPSPLNKMEQIQCQKTIEAALGIEVRISFRAEPCLIAGVELSGGALVLKNNWQNDLSQILHQLKSDDGQRENF